MSKNFYITTTLPYVNAKPHIGFAMEIIRADSIARYKKTKGYNVFFNTGTDEHGKKLWEGAEKEGISVQKYVDNYALVFKKLKGLLNISEDIHFIRTTDINHTMAVTEFWNKCKENGFIYKKNYKSKYCTGCELTKTDSELDGNGECREHPGRAIEFIDEENYFFKFSAFQDKLLDFYKKNPKFVIPNFRFNEVKSFVASGLEDFSVSRIASKMPWGIAVPDDKEQVIYVWFDALVNYISTLGWPNREEGNLFEKFWVMGAPVQYCGKDNLRQQSAMWQAMLMAAELPQSSHVIINGHITGDGGIKMSKSLGNTIDPYEIVKEYGAEALRYFVLREISSFEDSPFTLDRFKNSYNSGLANGIGNLTSRLMNMFVTYDIDISGLSFEPILSNEIENAYENFDLNKVMNIIWDKISILDQFIQETEPYKKIKINKEEAVIDLLKAGQDLACIAISLEPLLPETSKKIIDLLRKRQKPDSPLFLRKI